MKILSVSSGHDSNYCILEDGNLLIHNELERFTRVKHDWDENKLFELIKKQNHWQDYDHIVVPISFNNLKLGPLFLQDKNLIPVGHHTSHAASVYYNSGFEDAIIYTLDGGGFEPISFFTSGTVFIGNKNKVENVYKNYTWDLGHYWCNVLSNLGLGTVWSQNGDESGTLMAMAAYGNPYKYLELFDDIYFTNRYDWDQNKSDKIKNIVKNDETEIFNLAASLQYITEQFMKSFIFSHINCSQSENICFSGGTMLNCVALGKITKILVSKGYNVFCDQAPNDSGLSIGAAKYHYHHNLGNPLLKEVCKNSYFGKTYSKEEIINECIKHQNLNIKYNVELDKIVELLMGSKIISVFNEGSESGKRALGNRSIIADPRFAYMKDFINEKVKHRKSFRPFAPSVLREEVSKWFEIDIDSPYMSFAIEVKEEKRRQVPAILHKDNTARLQTVTKKDNGYYYDLIKLFFEKTGVPMILNTSFNDKEPIVETPEHAINCFLKTQIDHLYFVKEKILISKKIK